MESTWSRTAAEEPADGAVAGAADGGGGGGAGGPAQNRQQALQKLNEAADYFRRSEPHSPISYLVERAVRWGGMPLMEVLAECVEDPSALQRIQLNLGIRSSESEGG